MQVRELPKGIHAVPFNSITSCLSSLHKLRSACLFLQHHCICNAACPLNIISRLVSLSVIVTSPLVSSQSEADDGLTNERAMSYGGISGQLMGRDMTLHLDCR